MVENYEMYENLINAVVNQQKEIIGPIALVQAKSIKGLKIENNKVTFTSQNPKKTLEELVYSYADLFGKASIELSKEAIVKIHAPKNILPHILTD